MATVEEFSSPSGAAEMNAAAEEIISAKLMTEENVLVSSINSEDVNGSVDETNINVPNVNINSIANGVITDGNACDINIDNDINFDFSVENASDINISNITNGSEDNIAVSNTENITNKTVADVYISNVNVPDRESLSAPTVSLANDVQIEPNLISSLGNESNEYFVTENIHNAIYPNAVWDSSTLLSELPAINDDFKTYVGSEAITFDTTVNTDQSAFSELNNNATQLNNKTQVGDFLTGNNDDVGKLSSGENLNSYVLQKADEDSLSVSESLPSEIMNTEVLIEDQSKFDNVVISEAGLSTDAAHLSKADGNPGAEVTVAQMQEDRTINHIENANEVSLIRVEDIFGLNDTSNMMESTSIHDEMEDTDNSLHIDENHIDEHHVEENSLMEINNDSSHAIYPHVDQSAFMMNQTNEFDNTKDSLDSTRQDFCNLSGDINFDFLQSQKTGIKRKLDDEDNSESRKNSLPRCRMTRNYMCEYCNESTQNPRNHLYHIRDRHSEPIHIYECDRCQYASKNYTKLMRHIMMVHKVDNKEKDVNGQPIMNPEKFRAPENPNVPINPTTTKKSKPPQPKAVKVTEFSEACMDEEDEQHSVEMEEIVLPSKGEDGLYHCAHCEYTTKSSKHLRKHMRQEHPKRKSYKCSRCNYSTQIKSRYAKHMKYHDMPIVKCNFCDFGTPYRWNLERHLKNHLEDTGEFKCNLCNFSAQNRQSLTSHVANHHLTPEQIKERDSKRTIGIMDSEYSSDEDEMELMRMERDEHPDALLVADTSSFTVTNVDNSQDENSLSSPGEPGEPKKKKPKIKLTFKKMKISPESSEKQHNYGEDFVHPDDLVHRNGNVYIKNFKCEKCSFKAAFKSDLLRHCKKVHNSQIPDSVVAAALNENIFTVPVKLKNDIQNVSTEDHSNSNDSKEFKKKTDDNVKKAAKQASAQSLCCAICGHNAKCLSESVRHQKLHSSVKNQNKASSAVMAQCQFCKEKFKTVELLMDHLKTCEEASRNQILDDIVTKKAEIKEAQHDEEIESEPTEKELSADGAATTTTDPNSDDCESSYQTALKAMQGNVKTTDSKFSSIIKRVFCCPQCKFWSTTASRFHVHIVGHLNKKPYVCSECSYCSNWRWDITKHIKIRNTRDGTHSEAKVVITNETGEKNYEKYDTYIRVIQLDESASTRTEGGAKKSRNKRTSIEDLAPLEGFTLSGGSSPAKDSSLASTSAAKLPAGGNIAVIRGIQEKLSKISNAVKNESNDVTILPSGAMKSEPSQASFVVPVVGSATVSGVRSCMPPPLLHINSLTKTGIPVLAPMNVISSQVCRKTYKKKMEDFFLFFF